MTIHPTDTRADLNPYRMGAEIYDLISPYFRNKYKLEYVEVYSKDRLQGPAITWRTHSRHPGGGKNKVANARGSNYERSVGVDQFGQSVEQHKRQFTIVLDFAVYGTSSNEADEIAWDLENAIYDCEGQLQKKHDGLSLSFTQQLPDTNFSWRDADDLNLRLLRFEVIVPVREKVVLPQLREIQFTAKVGAILGITDLLTRTDSASTYALVLDDAKYVVKDIVDIKRKFADGRIRSLTQGIDYQKVKMDDRSAIIRWLDDFGAPPQVGDTFQVEYIYSYDSVTFSERSQGVEFKEVITESELST